MKRQNDVGVLIYGFNNPLIDYRLMAIRCAERVRKYWRLPVTVVTDVAFSHEDISCVVAEPQAPSKRLYSVYNSVAPFINGNRLDSYSLSPYSYTVVIDADFFVYTSQVPEVMTYRGLVLAKDTYSIDSKPLPQELHQLTRAGLPSFLATIVGFDRSRESELFFELWSRVRANYAAYSMVYGYNPSLFRNDYCVTVALDLLSEHLGSTEPFALRYRIPTASFATDTLSLDPLVFSTEGQAQEYANSDVHFLNKSSLAKLIT